jgi:hypothetical protein
MLPRVLTKPNLYKGMNFVYEVKNEKKFFELGNHLIVFSLLFFIQQDQNHTVHKNNESFLVDKYPIVISFVRSPHFFSVEKKCLSPDLHLNNGLRFAPLLLNITNGPESLAFGSLAELPVQ